MAEEARQDTKHNKQMGFKKENYSLLFILLVYLEL